MIDLNHLAQDIGGPLRVQIASIRTWRLYSSLDISLGLRAAKKSLTINFPLATSRGSLVLPKDFDPEELQVSYANAQVHPGDGIDTYWYQATPDLPYSLGEVEALGHDALLPLQQADVIDISRIPELLAFPYEEFLPGGDLAGSYVRIDARGKETTIDIRKAH